MKKIALFTATCLILMIFAGVVWAEQGLYLRGNLGLSFPKDSAISSPLGTSTIELDRGWTIEAAAGYRLDRYRFDMLRVEGEMGYQKNDISRISAGALSSAASGDFSSLWFLTNIYYDFYTTTRWTPFISAGIGVAKVKINDFRVGATPVGTADDIVMAYQVGAGVGYDINETLKLDVKYRYFATRDPNFDHGWNAEYGTHNLSFGLRYSF